jgi:hypothetical protein
MTNNLPLLIIVTLSYAGYNLFIKLASSQNINNTNSIAATLSLQIFALIVTSIFSVYLFSKGERIFVLPSKAYLYAIFAGINRDAPFIEMTDADWDSVISVHLKGTFICCQEFVKCKSQGNGHIINVSAACGIQGRKNGANFCSAKAGILALTKCLALELSPRIQVNCLIPSAVDTPEVRERYKLDTKEGFDSVVNGIPMGRLGKTEDVTQMVNCILSSSFTTGATFYVNGGEYMS